MNIDEIRARAEKATPGPWRNHDHNSMAKVGENPADWIGYAWVGYGGYPNGNFDAKIADLDARTDGSEKWREQKQHDAAFIAHARQDIPALIARVDELEAECDRQFIQGAEYALKVMVHHVFDPFESFVESGWKDGETKLQELLKSRRAAPAMKAPAKPDE